MIQSWQRFQHHSGYRVLLLLTAAVSPLVIGHAASSAADSVTILSQTPTPAPAPAPAPVDPTLDLPPSPTPSPAPAPAPVPTTPSMIDPPLNLPPSPIPAPAPAPAPAPVDPTLDLPPSPTPPPAPTPAPVPAPTPAPSPAAPAPVPTEPAPPVPTEPAPPYVEPPPVEPPYVEPPYTEPSAPTAPSSVEPQPAQSPAPSAAPALPPKSVRQSIVITPPPDATFSSLNVDEGDVVPGVLGQADYQVEGRRVDFYQFEGEANQQLVALLRNSNDMRITSRLNLIPYMLVIDPNGQVIAGTIVPAQYRVPTTDPLVPLDNQLFLRLPQSGRYTIAVFTEPNQTGRYGLTLKEDDRIYLFDETSELTDTSPILEATGTPSTVTEIEGQAGQRLQIEATSYQFDPRLILVDTDGTIVAEDDDGNGNFNARIDMTLPESGTYRAIVVPANPGGQGTYRLMVY